MTEPEALPSAHVWSYARATCSTHGRSKHRWRKGAEIECCACVAASPDAAAREAVQSAVHAKLANEHDPSACAVCAAQPESAQSRADTSPAVHEASVPVGGGVAEPTIELPLGWRECDEDCGRRPCYRRRDRATVQRFDGDAARWFWEAGPVSGIEDTPQGAFEAADRTLGECGINSVTRGSSLATAQDPLDALASAAAEAARALARMSGAIRRGDRAAAVQEARRASLELAVVAVRMNESAPLEALQHSPQRGADGGAGVPNGELGATQRPQLIHSADHSNSLASREREEG